MPVSQLHRRRLPHRASNLCRLFILTVCGLLLQACSSLKTTPPEVESSANLFKNNGSLQQWHIRGKIGVSSPDMAESAYLNWLQCQERFDIRLSGPLGMGSIKMLGDANQTVLFTPEGDQLTAASAEDLLRDAYGWPLPLEDLLYWVRGVPSPSSPHRAHAQGFEQLGWQVSYLRQQQAHGRWLPVKATAKQDALKVTLLLKEWQLSDICEH